MPVVAKFSARYVENLKHKAGEPRRTYYEESGHGNGSLGIRVSPSGNKTWVYTYSMDGKVRHMTLGTYPAMCLEDAHVAQAQAALERKKGFDPGAKAVETNKSEREAATVQFLADEYLKLYARPRKRSAGRDEDLLKRNVLPYWGKHKADAIHIRDVAALLDMIVARGAPIPANRTRSVLSKMFRWGRSRGLVADNPVAGVPAPSKENKRDRNLSDAELKKVLAQLPTADMGPAMRLALRFQLLTAARVGEVAGALWTEIDEKAATWTLPKERAKNGREHVLPLSPQALEVLEAAKALKGEQGVVFPSPMKGGAMRSESIAGGVRDNLEHFGVTKFTPHDIRRTVATGLSRQKAGREVLMKVLNHIDQTQAATYDRHDYAEEVRKALGIWGAHVAALETAGAAQSKGDQ